MLALVDCNWIEGCILLIVRLLGAVLGLRTPAAIGLGPFLGECGGEQEVLDEFVLADGVIEVDG